MVVALQILEDCSMLNKLFFMLKDLTECYKECIELKNLKIYAWK